MLFSPFQRRVRAQLRLSERRLLIMAGDMLCVIFAVLIALFIWAQVAEREFSFGFVAPHTIWFFLLSILWLLLASANDFYDLRVAKDRVESIQRLLLINAQVLVIYLIIFFFSPRDALPRLFILYYGVASFVLIMLWRMLNPALIGWAASPRRLLIIGTDESAQTIIKTIRTYGSDSYEIKGVIGHDSEVSNVLGDVAVIGNGDDLYNYVIRDDISELVITDIPDETDGLFRGVMEAYERGIALTPMPIMYERITGRVPVRHMKNHWAVVLPISGTSIFNAYIVLKRLMDLVLASFGFIVFLLLLPIVALVIRLDSPGNVFYTQIRMGLNGQAFRIVKFRTMVKDAEKGQGAVFSKVGDPRVTRVGRFMRKTRLDELPQVINVLRGEMSVVGPRPERPEHVKRLTQKIPFYRTRLVARPGLTGWAQVQYSYGSDDEDALVKLEYDLYYIRNQSLALDLNIMIRTVGKVLKMAGV